ncbi:primosomal protein N' [Lentilactobacillus sp. Marseille-Q4993]|uniref:primosomal protein N' n=1 Tax=Lentilactobacillus sp. Marseille-Q4993 TaxID=3039492 RepID=UPI0024BD4541|nr:primosomal protein N' [Lentilactobacillus sp. Marseille-Q4993]
MQIAQVIVDVSARQTNTPFSYLVPDNLENSLDIGMRVKVPFGPRKLTGFVVGFADQSSFNGRLKPIESVIDLYPVINPEMLKIASFLSKKTFSYYISCLQTMLPGGMKTKFDKVITAKDDQVAAEYPEIFNGNHELVVSHASNDRDQLAKLTKLRAAGKVNVDYRLVKKANPVQAVAIKSKLDGSQLNECLATVKQNAKAQRKLLETLIADPNAELLQSELVKQGVSSSAIKHGIDAGWVEKVMVTQRRNPFFKPVEPSKPLNLNSDQAKAVSKITEAIDHDENTRFLLEGVTGSGKTEVYLQSMAHALAMGKTALMLVPEITLTPQIVGRIRSRFGDQVAMLHSAMSTGERFDEWQRINRGEAKVVVGVRSAIFAPLTNVGLIIMDEEHDSSYKQGDNPRYQTRDVAKFRSDYNHCPVVFGSATPALESRARAQKGVYQLLKLPTRINKQALPHVDIVDMTDAGKQTPSMLSLELQKAVEERLTKHEQVILLLNRRGYASFLMCRDCGYVPKCPNCDISLTVHKSSHSLRCHYCGHEEPIPIKCPNCGGKRIRHFGYGSEQLEEQVNELFPEAKTLRMDVDTTRKKGSHERIIDEFGAHKADILLGTQMIAKGLDFPDVTLVGVLNADSALDFPDFRSSERTFELLTQVAGRAGRAEKSGQVIIQTFNPDHYAIKLAKEQDYEKFYETEMRVRQLAKYPPYYYTVKITGSGPQERKVAAEMYGIATELKQQLSNKSIVLGPTPKMITRINNQYYYQIIIKYRFEDNLQSTLEQLAFDRTNNRNGIQIAIDNDPLDLM